MSRWIPSKHGLMTALYELYVLSLQMSSGSLTACWQTRPSWQTLVWCPCRTLLLVSTGHIFWMRHGLLKVQASVKYTEYTVCRWKTPYSQRSMVLTHIACFVIINSLFTVMEWTTTGIFFHKDSTDLLTLWIFLYQTNVVKCPHVCQTAFNSMWYFSSALPGSSLNNYVVNI